ncbi:aldehyde dehydrogenase family protein [Gelidibacter japonicus]|uniref:aldehyde dehydrogenase family protein n=1 Tax=Gelidibacter japonicus TaxID=1962232 RepID=UPI002AFECD9F|nr:aldehyde dehydrogenase family protein [Gelidibacter japonicus]
MTLKMLIGENWIETKEKFSIQNAYSGRTVYYGSCASKKHVEDALLSAEKGKDISRELSPYMRSEILTKVVSLLSKRKEEFAKTIVSEGVKTINESRKEVDRCINTLTLCAEEAKRNNGEMVSFNAFKGSENRTGYYVNSPIGIVTAITPFNDPLNLVAHKLGPAVAAGNAIILKPSDFTPVSAIKLGELFLEAGLPYHVLNIVTGPLSNFGNTLVTDNRVNMVSFTGGTKSGEAITKMAGIKKVAMELGSSSPVIVMNDIDVDEVTANCLGAITWAAGQNCVGVKRMYVHEDIYDAFKNKLIECAKKINIGNPEEETTDMGPIISNYAIKEIEESIEELKTSGYTVIQGGNRINNAFEPTILEGDFDNPLNGKEEIFGPVATLSKIKTLEEGIKACNDSPYGLHAGIFTNNVNYAFKATELIQCGGVMVNDTSDYRIDMMPFGGIKQSGIGREGVASAIKEMTATKIVCFNLNNK